MTKPQTPKAQPVAPRPDFQARAPHPDDFAAWCEHPVTRFVAAAYQISATKQAEHWMAASWTGGEPDRVLLTELRARADAYQAFLETGLEQYRHVYDQER